MVKRYYVTGASGTGKTTVTKELNRRGILAIDQDSKEYGLCSWKHIKSKKAARFEYGIGKEFLDANAWFCDVKKLKQILKDDKNIKFVCGIAQNQEKYLNLFEKVFILRCKQNTLIKRIDGREDHQFGKHPSEKKYILNYYKKFEEFYIKNGAIPINSDRAIEKIVDEILKSIT